ncbi:hypothetical protein FRACYDRAFT_247265 [Fragilariopsis cylindrus CCMP1102]|uniref:MYND-type domain-containing protein n=1 Tax=Fragilariopsis cylindrus CCMP1102 TaxID=635003 RepID=A0A1E7EWA3_9STRA|nr:hypothetical protein FRACYDRAFT_247265 [Fragilariopsis cylindrus CCMP1102]|eukprot:OEU10310.1 hypothetical protein FRACYDRAFT_247265 [Fragilariopsis cylindrus CCMP1102]
MVRRGGNNRMPGHDDVVLNNLMGVDPSYKPDTNLTQEQSDVALGKLAPVLNALNRFVDHCKEEKLPIEHILEHKHFVSSSDDGGAFIITSLFNVTTNFTPPGTPRLSVVTMAVIRCHDNLRDSLLVPTGAEISDKYFSDFIDSQRRMTGNNFSPASYAVCKKLIKDCLIRMKKSKKVLIGNDQKTIVRLYDLTTSTTEENIIPTMPVPLPAPSVESLWLILNRAEYFSWSFLGDLLQIYGTDQRKLCITKETLVRSLRYVASDKYRRERLYAMIELHCMYHMLEDEAEVASWLLWELQSMRNYDDEDGAINDFLERGTLPPNFVYDATVAKATSSSSTDDSQSSLVDEFENVDISQIIKDLKRKRSGCALCGATRFKGGSKLREYIKCKAVVYCCRNHQVLHWKNGHKQECSPPDLETHCRLANTY